MDAHTQERLRTELDGSRQDLIVELKRLGADPESGNVRELGDVDDNFADSASATAERSEKLTLIEQATDRLADVERALERMDDGEYGICERCGREISTSRLEARPMSVLCVECASAS
ncbi:MAG TPA: TraR/DksA C4-type zinc finger protein [Euzebyales bacterium]|nr:TraR/DksA C4-type zinc finger protein [Euzebyales bacterium]